MAEQVQTETGQTDTSEWADRQLLEQIFAQQERIFAQTTWLALEVNAAKTAFSQVPGVSAMMKRKG